MRVIVVADMDGHTNVYAVNRKNIEKLLRFLIDSDFCEDQSEIEEFLKRDPQPSEDELLAFLTEQDHVNSRHAHIHVLEVEKRLNPRCNPLQ